MHTFDWTVVSVQPCDDYTLKIRFADGSRKRFDVAPLLEHGVFRVLKDRSVFMGARVEFGTVTWDGEIDIAPERLYEQGVALAD